MRAVVGVLTVGGTAEALFLYCPNRDNQRVAVNG
jgi:hypothetical protein